ncbi:MAG: DUF814 domain-containing protein [Candidatus Latescibacterota bacterium]|nr:MAG: DUF814 domain-containing protein [Candidatus Latescibacterota bacterium]
MNHFLLHLFVRGAGQTVCGKTIGSVRYLAPVLSIELIGGAAPCFLASILSSPGPFVYLTDTDPLGGAGTEVFKRIRGLPVGACEQIDDDRMVRFELGRDRDRVELVLRLFGSAGKARILGAESIIESLDSREAGRPRPAPTTPRAPSLAVADADTLIRAVETGPGQPVPGLTEELIGCFTADRGPVSPVDVRGLVAWRDEMIRGSCRFHLGSRSVRSGGVVPLPDPVPSGLAIRLGPFDRIDVACRRAGDFILESIRDDMIANHAAPLKRHLDSRRRLADDLDRDLKTADSFEMWRKEANVLAAFQSKIPPGSSAVILPDPYGSEKEITIKLDPALPVSDQIEKRFKRAAKLERSRDAIAQRIRAVREDIASLEKELDAVAKQGSLGDAIRSVDSAIERCGLGARLQTTPRDTRQSKTYRRFELDRMWFALVGRNNKENDEITFRVAAPDDIWMHAQQVAGSHVILKSHGAPGNPSDSILQTAAGIAAYFSKARHASLVPVIYTHRKYVRKFRGARPGQVTCEREKTIMAEPALPDTPARGSTPQ